MPEYLSVCIRTKLSRLSWLSEAFSAFWALISAHAFAFITAISLSRKLFFVRVGARKLASMRGSQASSAASFVIDAHPMTSASPATRSATYLTPARTDFRARGVVQSLVASLLEIVRGRFLAYLHNVLSVSVNQQGAIMPRKSQSAASFPPPMKPRLQSAPLIAPKGMTARAAAIFRDLTESVEPDHFDESDLPLLRQYCAAVDLAEQAEAALAAKGPVTATGRPSPWLTVQEKQLRALAALSMRLRLSPQSRATGKRRLPFGRLV